MQQSLLSLDQLSNILQCSLLKAGQWERPLNAAMIKWQITTPLQIAGFLSQISKESGGLTQVVENMNYSAEGLAKTWPSRYAVDPHARDKTPNALALRLHRNPVLIANYTYANRMGNGSPESGDGYRNRGRGPKQITGETNYRAYFKAAGLPENSDRDLLLDPMVGADAAGWFWSVNGCAALAECRDVKGLSRRINGGLIGFEDGDTVGLNDRVELWDNALSILGVVCLPASTPPD